MARKSWLPKVGELLKDVCKVTAAAALGILVADRLIERAHQPVMDRVSFIWSDTSPLVELPVARSYPLQDEYGKYSTEGHVIIPEYDSERLLREGRSTVVLATDMNAGVMAECMPSDHPIVLAASDGQGGWQVAKSDRPLYECYPPVEADDSGMCLTVPLGRLGVDACLGYVGADGRFVGLTTHVRDILTPQQASEHYAGAAVAMHL